MFKAFDQNINTPGWWLTTEMSTRLAHQDGMSITSYILIMLASKCLPPDSVKEDFLDACFMECSYSERECRQLYNAKAVESNCDEDYLSADICSKSVPEPIATDFFKYLSETAQKETPGSVNQTLSYPKMPSSSFVSNGVTGSIPREDILSGIAHGQFITSDQKLKSFSVSNDQTIPTNEQGEPTVATQKAQRVPGGSPMPKEDPAYSQGQEKKAVPVNQLSSADIDRGFLLASASLDVYAVNPVENIKPLANKQNKTAQQALDLKKYLPGAQHDPQNPKITIWYINSQTIQLRCRRKLLNCN